jgi:predicted dehydrogenase
MGSGARGCFTASQVSAGRKNGLAIEIYGRKAGVSWRQERPDELWIGYRDRENSLFLRDPALMTEAARSYSDYPQGHAEGYPDTFKQTFRRFYESIANPNAVAEYPTFADGLRQLRILDAELESHRTRAWVDVLT